MSAEASQPSPAVCEVNLKRTCGLVTSGGYRVYVTVKAQNIYCSHCCKSCETAPVPKARSEQGQKCAPCFTQYFTKI